MTEQQRQTDNRLLEMIQRNFPSLPLDDRYTDWSKWLGFARAAYEAGALDERVACELRCAKTPVLLQGHHEYTALNVQKMMMEAISERPNTVIERLPAVTVGQAKVRPGSPLE